MAEERSSVAEIRDAFMRTKNALKKTEQQMQRATGATVRWGASQLGGFVAGGMHERFGKMDERAGVKIIRVGGVHAGIVVSFAGLGAELLEAAGDKSDVLGSFGAGIGAQGFGDQGRAFVRTLAKRKSERDAEKDAEKNAQGEAATSAVAA